MDIELLAPAGSYDSLNAAINAGCNAVFLGVTSLNMRASAAANFTLTDLPKIMDIAKKANIKVYVTLNTLVYDDEIKNIAIILDEIKKNNVDAVIVADQAVMIMARERDIEVHISTQLSVSNIETVKFYAKFADRIVLARELSLDQVKHICSEIRAQKVKGPKGNLVEIEVFAHGALCVAVSGRCGMSLYNYNSSANRGRCSQVCRHPFKVVDEFTGHEMKVDNNYIMSSADLCTIGMLDKLVQSGIKVLKIEGRGRSADYVDTVIKTYRNALDAIENDTYNKEKIKQWNVDLGTVFNRGFTTNFYMGRSLAEWANGSDSKATKVKLKVGVVEHYYAKKQIAQILIQSSDVIKPDMDFVIIGNTTGVVRGKLSDFMVNDKTVDSASKGDVVTLQIDQRVRENDIFYLLVDKSE